MFLPVQETKKWEINNKKKINEVAANHMLLEITKKTTMHSRKKINEYNESFIYNSLMMTGHQAKKI